MLGNEAAESTYAREGSGGKWVVASLTTLGFGLIFLLALSIDPIGWNISGRSNDFNSLSYDNVVMSLLGHLSREATTTSSVAPVLAELKGGGGEGSADKLSERGEGKGTESLKGTPSLNGIQVGTDGIAHAPSSNGSQMGLFGVGSAPPFIGEWVPNPNPGPLYDNSCPYISVQWTCPNFNIAERLSFWWKPSGSAIPFFDSKTFLSRMAGKTVGFYGDSLGRQQFQALLCTLSSRLINGGGQDVTEVSAQWKRRKGRIIAYYFTPSKITVFYRRTWSLCLEEPLGPKKIALHLDRAEGIVKTMRLADVVVINTGHHLNAFKLQQHHWVPYLNGKEIEKPSLEDVRAMILRNIVKEADAIVRQAKAERVAWHLNHRKLAAADSHRKADTKPLRSSRKLREKKEKKPRVPTVYMRTLSPMHWTQGEWNSGGKCDEFRKDGKASPRHPASIPDLGHTMTDDPIMKDIIRGTSVRILDITRLSVLRPDMHPASDRPQNKANAVQEDCLHWCLPGVPDTWNSILFADFFDKKLQ